MTTPDAFAAELRQVPDKLIRAMRATTVKAGVNIRDAAKASASRRYVPRFPSSILLRTEHPEARVVATVESSSPFGAILEFGTPTSPANPAITRAFEAEVPRWLEFLDKAAGDAFL